MNGLVFVTGLGTWTEWIRLELLRAYVIGGQPQGGALRFMIGIK
jgi:hypothetical protein